MTAQERSAIPAPGVLVDVGDGMMHVASSGSGAQTIVLIPGLGTSSPYYDFQPLVDSLAKSARVVVVEPFGYGWSDSNDRPMTLSNVALDIHDALIGAGVPGPYVIAAHSIGGLYAQQFATDFPADTAAVIGLDPTLPRAQDFAPKTSDSTIEAPIPAYLGWATAMGWARPIQLALGQDPQLTSGAASADGYSRSNLAAQQMFTNWTGLSRNVMDQSARVPESVLDAAELEFPADTPVLLFITAEHGEPPAWLQRAAADYVAASTLTRIVPVNAGHYLHHTKSTEIAAEIQSFLAAHGR